MIKADYAEIELRIIARLLAATFSKSEEELLALGYGMPAHRRWDMFVPKETRDRIRRRRRRRR